MGKVGKGFKSERVRDGELGFINPSKWEVDQLAVSRHYR